MFFDPKDENVAKNMANALLGSMGMSMLDRQRGNVVLILFSKKEPKLVGPGWAYNCSNMDKIEDPSGLTEKEIDDIFDEAIETYREWAENSKDSYLIDTLEHDLAGKSYEDRPKLDIEFKE